MRNSKLTVILFVLGMFLLTCLACAQNIEEIVHDKTTGKSNLNENVKVKDRNSLVLFYDGNHLDNGAHRNERYVFEELAKKYSNKIYFYSYNISMENGYKNNGTSFVAGTEVKNEGIVFLPSFAMYKDGKQIDIRQGRTTMAEFVDANLVICDLWIMTNLADKYIDSPNTIKFRNTSNLKKVLK